MINRIQEKSQECKVLLDKIKGGHSFASIESSFYRNTNLNDLFSAINKPEAIPFFISDISWINFYDLYNEYGGTRKELGVSSLIHEIRQNFQRTWSFSKMYNPIKSEQLAHFEMQINSAIDEVEDIILELLDVYQSSEIYHFDTGGYDYSLIAIELIEGVQVIEFLWYID